MAELSGTLGERVRALLDAQGLSVSELAERTGIHRVSVSKVVNGRVTDPAVSIVVAIAEALGVTPGSLIDGPPPRPMGKRK